MVERENISKHNPSVSGLLPNWQEKGWDGIRRIYFIGIGGIGMSALARYFRSQGKGVSGYDKTETELTRQLIGEGIPVHYEENLDLAPKDVQLVVYTPAVARDNKELLYYQQQGYTIMKRSEVLGVITKSSFNICVAGTHGKTTISTMIAHILRHSGYGCNAFLGGISVNYDSNFWSDQRNVCVVEADEYDRSFLKLSPDIAVITAMDADHLDIYGTKEALEEAFIRFSQQLKSGGLLISKYGLSRDNQLKAGRHIRYHIKDEHADIHAENIRLSQGSYEFDVVMRGWRLRSLVLNMGGMHNVENAIAAISAAHALEIDEDKIKSAIAAFRGVKRRFEYIIKNEGLRFIDDYAHHPEELRAVITSVKDLFPGSKCVVAFQPHLYSRTRDFADGFAKSLDLADEAIVLPIYPARELPIEGVTSAMILGKMKSNHKHLMTKGELLDWIKGQKIESLITAGAGDIDELVLPIKEIIEKRS
jgi:UDP-N-acetylmuramate--alanine ligase